MPESKTARWKVILGYLAFSLFALAVSFYLTFPYGALESRVKAEAEKSGLHVQMASLGPGLFGLTATGVRLSKLSSGAEEKPPEPVTLQSVSVRPSLFPLGVSVRARVLGGNLSLRVGGLKQLVVQAQARELNLAEGNLKAVTGLDLSGRASGELELSIPKTTIGGSKVLEPDLGQASGTLSLRLNELIVKGGTVTVPIPMYGPEPTPVDLPKVVLGEVELGLKFEKGAGTLEAGSVKGQGLEAKASGSLKLAKRLEYSEPNVELRLKAEPEFVKSLGMYGAGLSMLRADPKDPSWRLGQVSGYLGGPRFH